MDTLKEHIYQNFHDASLVPCYAQIDDANDVLKELLPESNAEIQEALHSYDQHLGLEIICHSNSIEGSTLTSGETEDVLNGHFFSNKSTQEQLAARGLANGLEFMSRELTKKTPISEDFIKDLHERTTEDLHVRLRGVYRTVPVFIRGSKTVPPDAIKARALMADLVYAYNESALHPIWKATALHVLFENIHPFRDGNGRTGRLLLNYMLELHSYPPIVLKSDKEQSYLAALEQWQAHANTAPFVSLVNRTLEAQIQTRIGIIRESRETLSRLEADAAGEGTPKQPIQARNF
ncbi:MAG: Fic family protein [Coriobacteriales bacterium]|jgi:Fic family protein|nr:Fic family protein [Coriobacteriales bacterium]